MKQPKPKKNNYPNTWDLVIMDMKARDTFGFKKYKTHLQPFNGRNTLQDVYEELLDAVVYIKTLICETEIDNFELNEDEKYILKHYKE